VSRGRRPKRVLAVSSGGGHWVELLRLAPAFEAVDVAYVTVRRDYGDDVAERRFYVVNDATRWNKLAVMIMAFRLLVIMMWERPDVVITTGAAPGYFALGSVGGWGRSRCGWTASPTPRNCRCRAGSRAGTRISG